MGKKTSIAILILFFAFAYQGGAQRAIAQVKSTTAENFAQYGPEDAYWVFSAICVDDTERPIQRKTDGNQWCGQDIDGFCDQDKTRAAELVCSARYTEGLALQREAQRAEQARAQVQRERERQQVEQRIAEQEARAEQERRQQARIARANDSERISIEEELIRIQQEKLELRREELELQRRADEIQGLLGIEDAPASN